MGKPLPKRENVKRKSYTSDIMSDVWRSQQYPLRNASIMKTQSISPIREKDRDYLDPSWLIISYKNDQCSRTKHDPMSENNLSLLRKKQNQVQMRECFQVRIEIEVKKYDYVVSKNYVGVALFIKDDDAIIQLGTCWIKQEGDKIGLYKN